jgi:hypothetical protein
MKLLYDFYHRDPVVQITRQFLYQTLLAGGLFITQGKQPATDEFEYILQQYWIPFIKIMLDHLKMFGFCPWKVITVKELFKGQKRSVNVPHVLPFGTYRVSIRLSNQYQQVYSVYPMKSETLMSASEADKSIHLLVDRANQPDIHGVLRSPLLPLFPGYSFSAQMYEYALQTEYIRSHPPLITETKADKSSNNEAVAMEMFGDADAFMSRNEASYVKNRTRVEEFQRQQNMARDMNAHTKRGGFSIDPFTGQPQQRGPKKKQWEDSVFILPEGHSLCGHVNPQARSDLLDIDQSRYDLICGIMGVPRCLLLPAKTGGLNVNVSDMSYKLFMRTMTSLKETTIQYLQCVYQEIYKELADIQFPMPMLTSLDDLQRLQDNGVVDRKTFGEHLLGTMGLDKDLLNLQPLEPPTQEVRGTQRGTN